MLGSPSSCVDFFVLYPCPLPSYMLRRSSQFMAQEYDIPSPYLFDHSNHRSFLSAVHLGLSFWSRRSRMRTVLSVSVRPLITTYPAPCNLGNCIPVVSLFWDSGFPCVRKTEPPHGLHQSYAAWGWITPISLLHREPCPKSPPPLRTKPNPPPHPLPRNLLLSPDKISCPGLKLSCPHHKSGTRTTQPNEGS